MRLWGYLAIATPVAALGIAALHSLLPVGSLYLYAVVFAVVGMQGIANLAGFLNWVLEYAPASDRPMYIGFANTLSGASLVMPLIGGWILSATGSYPVLFVAAMVGPVVALVLLRKLPEPRHGGAVDSGRHGGAVI
jgi:MFS family permease